MQTSGLCFCRADWDGRDPTRGELGSQGATWRSQLWGTPWCVQSPWIATWDWPIIGEYMGPHVFHDWPIISWSTWSIYELLGQYYPCNIQQVLEEPLLAFSHLRIVVGFARLSLASLASLVSLVRPFPEHQPLMGNENRSSKTTWPALRRGTRAPSEGIDLLCQLSRWPFPPVVRTSTTWLPSSSSIS